MRIRLPLAAAVLSVAAGCVPVSPAPVAPETFDLVVAATTDVHGRLRGWNYESNRPDTLRGLTRVATIVDSVRS